MPGSRKPKLAYTLRLRCPLCGAAPIFRSWLRPHAECGACGWAFEREQGYFLGSIYVNYSVTTVLAAGVWFLLEIQLELARPLALGGVALFVVVFPLWFLRYARAVFMHLDLACDQPD